ncbi:MAG TPA: regulatory iron-sulfur-containing complex subunit RicT [Phycisphaeraceae bacterium]
MPGTITPLPILLEEEDRKAYEKLQIPKTIVVRYGYLRQIAELPYDGTAKPGCGSKVVIRTGRGVELAEMLTTTCPNSGCAKSVSRKQMLQYIENSGGKEYPFTTSGKVLRVATIEDLNEQARLDARKPQIIQRTKTLIAQMGLAMRLVEVELLLGGERIVFYYTAEQWVDFRELVKRLASEYQTRIEMHQVNAREEARLVADYEKCGQHCCCKQFLKVLKPVSMKSAKIQKATLDPMKISGRCGRLMCCLRYEDATYEELRKRLPHRKSLVETPDGVGLVMETQILTQLVLVQVGSGAPAAYPVEDIRVLSDQEAAAYRAQQREAAQQASSPAWGGASRSSGKQGQRPASARPSQPAKAGRPTPDLAQASATPAEPAASSDDHSDSVGSSGGYSSGGYKGQATASVDSVEGQPGQARKKRRRRRRRRRGGEAGQQGGGSASGQGSGPTPPTGPADGD